MLAAILATAWGWDMDITFALRTKAIPAHVVATAAIGGPSPVVVPMAAIHLVTADLEQIS